MTSRRDFLALVAACSARLTLASKAAPKHVIRMAIPSGDPSADAKTRDYWAGLFVPHGFRHGDNLLMEVARAKTIQLDPNPEYDSIVTNVLRKRPDLILVHMSWLPFFASATSEVPIVFAGMIEPEYNRIIDSARRPGGNVTGALYPLFELQAKRIEFAKEIHAKARRAAVVCSPGGLLDLIHQRFKTAARSLGMEGFALPMSDFEERGRVAMALRQARVDIADMIVLPHPETFSETLQLGIACTASGADVDGLLVGYNVTGVDETAVALAARILRGEKVATLPAQQPDRFHMELNVRTAKKLGLTVPSSMLLRAQRVLE